MQPKYAVKLYNATFGVDIVLVNSNEVPQNTAEHRIEKEPDLMGQLNNKSLANITKFNEGYWLTDERKDDLARISVITIDPKQNSPSVWEEHMLDNGKEEVGSLKFIRVKYGVGTDSMDSVISYSPKTNSGYAVYPFDVFMKKIEREIGELKNINDLETHTNTSLHELLERLEISKHNE